MSTRLNNLDFGGPDDSDNDSGIDCQRAESTQSVTASVLDHQFLYGRRWQSARWGRIVAPNDEFEQELMTMFHLISLSVSYISAD